jgi:hypothetical protein
MTHALVVALALVGAAGAAEPLDGSAEPSDGSAAAEPAESAESTGAAESADPEAASPEVQAAAPKPADLLAEMARMRAELEAMKKELEATRATVEGQDQRLEGTVKDLTNLRTKMVSAKDFKIDLTGYYRVRGYVYGAKFGEDKPVTGGLFNNQPTSGRFMNQRLRVGVKFGWKDVASLNVHFQALDDVVWGDNADIGSNPLFAEQGSYTGIDGLENPNFEVFRAWAEMKVPLGLIRVGRQSSHWGLGLLANHGDGFDDDFGENHFGNQFDRFLFATNPIAIAQAFTKKQERKTPQLNVVVAVDRLVEDPLTQYYGYKCTPGIDREVDPARYDVRCDSDGDGYTDRDHDYVDDTRTADQRRPDWWVDQKDDVWEMVYALLYRGKDIRYFGGVGDLTAGAYLIHRRQKETDSDVIVADLYLDAFIHHVGLQFEGVGIWGKTRALPLPDSTQDDPLAKRAAIMGYAARLFYEQPYWKVLFESGYASGDNQANDALFTGRSLHPDYNVGLILYEDVIAQVTSRLWGDNARGLRSNGGVYDSHYINPRVYAYPLPNWQVIAGVLAVWPHKADGAIVRCGPDDPAEWGCAARDAKSDMLGYEVDLAIKHKWQDHLNFTLETGWAHATDRLALAAAGLNVNENGAGNFWTLQSRIAWEF